MSRRLSTDAFKTACESRTSASGRGRGCAFLVGAVLLFAAAMKLVDPFPFLLAVSAVAGGLPGAHGALVPAALVAAAVGLEVFMALCLVIGWARRPWLVVAALFLVAGIGFQVALRREVGDGSCGCFGSLFGREEPLALAVARNAGLAGLCVMGVFGSKGSA